MIYEVYGSHRTDMQFLPHLAAPGWVARVLGICLVEGSPGGLGPLMRADNGGLRLQSTCFEIEGLSMNLRLKFAGLPNTRVQADAKALSACGPGAGGYGQASLGL